MAARRTPRVATSRAEKRWRPLERRGPVCRYTFDDVTCSRRGAHHCVPRANRAVGFYADLLVHTKGRFARQSFVLEDWQEHDIIRPIFGEVRWSPEWGSYVRRYTVAYIVLARKNGKSEKAAGLVHLLLVGDDEESAEVYGAAKDTKQAGKVADVVERMRKLSPPLADRLKFNKNSRRVYDDTTGSYYEVITAEALGELGHNPHGFVLDEALSQPDGSLWEAMRTAAGARAQPLFLVITTETNDLSSWGATVIDEAERVEEDPARAPHVFAYVRKLPRTDDELERLRRIHAGHPDLPVSLDVWDEANWRWPNPALGSFLSAESLRQEALEARNDPAKENGWRQFRLNQRVSQVTRWMPMHRWDGRGNVQLLDEDALDGASCFAGLDLASTTDLAAWVLWFPDQREVLFRFWTPEAQIPRLDRATGGQASVWVREGFLYATEGDWIDYLGDPETGRSVHSLRGPHHLAIHPQIEADKDRFRILRVGYDQKEATATAQFMQGLGLDIQPVFQGFSLSESLKELMRLVGEGEFRHGGHPVARWNADSVEVKRDDQDRIKIVKPDRGGTGKRIDGIAAAANAINVAQHFEGGVEQPAEAASF